MKKQIVPLILSALLCASPVASMAQDDQGLSQAISSVKSVLTIPDDYQEFDYRKYAADDTTIWNLSWNREDGGSISASVDQHGHILSFYHWDAEDFTDGLAAFSTEQSQEIAHQFLQKLFPDTYDRLRLVSSESSNSESAYYVYQETFEEIPVYGATYHVTVDRKTGEVTNYNGSEPTAVSVPSTEGTIDISAAKEAYLKNAGLELVYSSYYDYKEKEFHTFPKYIVKRSGNIGIDASTGELVSYTSADTARTAGSGGGSANKAEATAMDASAEEFTPEEKEAIANMEGLISPSDAEQIIRGQFPLLTSEFVLSSNNISKVYDDPGEYVLSLNFQLKETEDADRYGYAYATLNAKTGEILSFQITTPDATEKKISQDDAKKIADEFLTNLDSEKMAQLRYEDNDPVAVMPIAKTEDSVSQGFRYYRMVNGIRFLSDVTSVTVNGDGNITSYSSIWHKNASFPAVSDAMTDSQMMDIIADSMDFGMMYAQADDTIKLVYDFREKNYTGFDPITGKPLNSDGSEYIENKAPTYTDLDGHWAQSIVMTLADNGYYLDGAQFNPDVQISKKDFLLYNNFAYRSSRGSDDENIIDLIAEVEEIDKSQVDVNAPMTRQLVAKYYVTLAGYGKVAQYSEIYVYPFQDEEAITPSYKGYIAIAKAMGIMNGDEEGNFNPDQLLTRAEAASCLYNYKTVK